MSSTCSEIDAMTVSSNDFNTIPSKKSMSSSDECLAMDVNINLWSKLQKLNKKIKTTSIRIK